MNPIKSKQSKNIFHFNFPLFIIGFGFFNFVFHNSCYAQLCPRERIYIHTDKSSYVAGEQIWLKAYIYSKFAPDEVATVLNIEIIDENNRLISTHTLPISQGVASGNINISDSLNEGAYIIKGFTKKLLVSSENDDLSLTPVYIFNTEKPQINIRSQVASVYTNHQFSIFPNSGKLVTGIVNEIYFNVVNNTNLPEDAAGYLSDLYGDTICSFKSTWNGYGHFSFTPLPDQKYKVWINWKGNEWKSYLLDEFVTDRVTIRLTKKNESVIFQVHIPTALQNGSKASIMGILDGNVVFKKDFPLLKDLYSAVIPTSELPPSILDFMVIGNGNKVLGYSSQVINGQQALLPVLFNIDSLNFTPGGKNTFTFNIPDSIMGNMSISVTDFDKDFNFPVKSTISSLILHHYRTASMETISVPQNDNWEDISNIVVNSSVRNEKEMLTYLDTAVRNCSIPDSNYISISGRVFKKNGQLVVKGDLKLLFSQNDSGVSIFLVPIDNKGRFVIKNLVFQGTGTFKYLLNSSSEEVMVKLDTALQKPNLIPLKRELFQQLNKFINYKDEIKRKVIGRLNDSIYTNHTLTPVTVKKNIGRPIDRVISKYTHGVFNNSLWGKTFDFINDPPAVSGGNILDYLLGKVNGLSIRILPNGEYQLENTGKTSFSNLSGNPSVRLYLNEVETSLNFITMIHPNDVALVKYYRAGLSPIPGVGMASTLAIYTRKYDDYPELASKKIPEFKVEGFDKTKKYSVEMAAARDRTTLYWNPSILLDTEKKSFTFHFQNTDYCQKFFVKIEGFSSDGRLISFEKIIE